MQLPDAWLGVFALVILVCAILGGAFTAYARLADKNTPIDTGLVHGRAGVIGILLLILMQFTGNESGKPIIPALTLFIVTVLLGAALYYIIRRKGILPKTIIFIHGTLAVSALAVFLFGSPL